MPEKQTDLVDERSLFTLPGAPTLPTRECPLCHGTMTMMVQPPFMVAPPMLGFANQTDELDFYMCDNPECGVGLPFKHKKE